MTANPDDPNTSKPLSRILAGQGMGPAALAMAVALVAAIVGTLHLTRFLFPTASSTGYGILIALFALLTRVAGRGAGYSALAATSVAVAYFLLDGDGFAVASSTDALGLILFVASGGSVVFLVGSMGARASDAEARVRTLTARDTRRAALLAELSHRIGNDLGALVSVSELQATKAAHAETRQAMSAIADRIHVLGKVYGRLRVITGGDATLDMGQFLEGLCEDLEATHLALRPVSLEAEIERVTLPANQAVLVGLVLNEAVTNALKYAFPDDGAGRIVVSFGPDPGTPGRMRLQVSDDGTGPGDCPSKGTGMGQRLMRGMASQLRGSYVLAREGDVTVSRLTFPLATPGETRR